MTAPSKLLDLADAIGVGPASEAIREDKAANVKARFAPGRSAGSGYGNEGPANRRMKEAEDADINLRRTGGVDAGNINPGSFNDNINGQPKKQD